MIYAAGSNFHRRAKHNCIQVPHLGSLKWITGLITRHGDRFERDKGKDGLVKQVCSKN